MQIHFQWWYASVIWFNAFVFQLISLFTHWTKNGIGRYGMQIRANWNDGMLFAPYLQWNFVNKWHSKFHSSRRKNHRIFHRITTHPFGVISHCNAHVVHFNECINMLIHAIIVPSRKEFSFINFRIKFATINKQRITMWSNAHKYISFCSFQRDNHHHYVSK